MNVMPQMKTLRELIHVAGKTRRITTRQNFLNPDNGNFASAVNVVDAPVPPLSEVDLVDTVNTNVERVSTLLNTALALAAANGITVTVSNNAIPNQLAMGVHLTFVDVYPNRDYVSMNYQAIGRFNDEKAQIERIAKHTGTSDVYVYNATQETKEARVPALLVTYINKVNIPCVLVLAAAMLGKDQDDTPLYHSAADYTLEAMTLNEIISGVAERLQYRNIKYDPMSFDSWPWPLTRSEPQTAVVDGIETHLSLHGRGRCIQCDRCKSEYNGGNGTTKEGPIRVYRSGQDAQLIEDARKLGWRVGGRDGKNEDLCPVCYEVMVYLDNVLAFVVNTGQSENIITAMKEAQQDRDFFKKHRTSPRPDVNLSEEELHARIDLLMGYDAPSDQPT